MLSWLYSFAVFCILLPVIAVAAFLVFNGKLWVRRHFETGHFRKVSVWGGLILFGIGVEVFSPGFPGDGLCRKDVPQAMAAQRLTADNIPKWNGRAYVEINNGMPLFSEKKKKGTGDYVKYSPLDSLGRAGRAIGCLGPGTINHGEREGIGSIRPSGWETRKYPDLIKDRYVYNRCHLLMQAVAAGMDSQTCNSVRNLITGTRYMNVDGMLAYESELLSYLRSTKNHVLYRVTPIYKGDELVARGVQLEAWSVEDSGRGLHFNVFCYNVQPGIAIDYATGKTNKKQDAQGEIASALAGGSLTVAELPGVSQAGKSKGGANSPASAGKSTGGANRAASAGKGAGSSDRAASAAKSADGTDRTASAGTDTGGTEIYVLNTNTRRFHFPDCYSVNQMSDRNKEIGHYSRSELIDRGYRPCGNCKP